jgi:hypothetical protein
MRWYWVLVAVLVAAVVLVLRRRRTRKRISFGRAMEKCDTGDLVLFRHREFSISRVVSHFTHAGIVIVGDDGVKYILESHARGDVGNNTGVNVYDLAWRIRTYEGTTALARLRAPLAPHQRARLARGARGPYRRIPFFKKYADHYARNCLLALNIPRAPGMFCSEFVGHVQQKLGLRSRQLRTDCLTPDDLATAQYREIVDIQ